MNFLLANTLLLSWRLDIVGEGGHNNHFLAMMRRLLLLFTFHYIYAATKTSVEPLNILNVSVDEKHIPIRQPAVTCCGSPLVFTFDEMPNLPTISLRSKSHKSSCPTPTETTTTSTISKSSSSSRTRQTKKVDEKCITSIVDPQTVYITRTSTVYSTTVRTVKNILRETSFSTTTKTSTIKLTSTVLSISAQTKFSNLFVTLPTFVLVTRYRYFDITNTSTQTLPTFVLTFTEQETIFRNEGTTSYVSTTVTDCELSIFLETESTSNTSTITFTDPTVTTISQGVDTLLFTTTLTLSVTTFTEVTVAATTVNFLVPATTVFSIPTIFTVDVIPNLGATYLTVFVVDPNPQTILAVSSTFSVTIQ